MQKYAISTTNEISLNSRPPKKSNDTWLGNPRIINREGKYMLLLKVYTLIVMVALAGCQKEVKKEISSESRESKRDELVFKLVTDKRWIYETVLS